ncbi:MAG: phospho-sugar mutase [Ruminococcaceae bacterium]|nr:phospho-sugar mutase [Oscillospiraceae bacterium]
MDYMTEYKRWKENVADPILKKELEEISDKPEEIKERFAISLTFGTAGLRGILGAGTNMMNIYTVSRTTQGLSNYLLSKQEKASVAIAYDSRNMSKEFAEYSACVLAANGIKAHIYKVLMPTPMLSFAVRELKCDAGIMITASHNPAAYNGYKAYGPDGCQMNEEDSENVLKFINELDVLTGAKKADFDDAVEKGLIEYIGDDVIEKYYDAVKEQQILPGICKENPIKVVFSPLHGTGNIPVRRILKDIGLDDVTVVKEQENPDGNFPTAPYPNPETADALKLGLEVAKKIGADIFIATDPDADRVGTAVKDGENYLILNGNQIGILLFNYISTVRNQLKNMPDRALAVRSVVSTPMVDKIAKDTGVEMVSVLTGFKNIGEKILRLEEKGEEKRFIFGFEESCGYLAGSYVRDKDAVLACMLICEMACYYKSIGISVVELMNNLYEKYGYFLNNVVNLEFPGLEGADKMKAIMQSHRESPLKEIGGQKVERYSDYLGGKSVCVDTGEESEIDLPKSDIVSYNLEGGAEVIVRPSGTEPKMKVYITVCEENYTDSADRLEVLISEAKQFDKV